MPENVTGSPSGRALWPAFVNAPGDARGGGPPAAPALPHWVRAAWFRGGWEQLLRRSSPAPAGSADHESPQARASSYVRSPGHSPGCW